MTPADMEAVRDDLNRLAKLLVDEGSVSDIAEANACLQAFRVRVFVGPEVNFSAAHQAALLTIVNVACRFALGGVLVSGPLDGPRLVNVAPEPTLAGVVASLGGRHDPAWVPGTDSVPTVVIGSSDLRGDKVLRATFEGWRGGVVRRPEDALSNETNVMPAAVLAGALAAAELFAMLRGDVQAGHRDLGLSLWRPDKAYAWREREGDGPALAVLPSSLWILGLGHLGQAFLWAVMMCPYPNPGEVKLTLQDFDTVTRSTVSTSILTDASMIKRRKTRTVVDVLEGRGFSTTIVERKFDGAFRRRETEEPSILVCGVDNPVARSEVEDPGFQFVVEAGIGSKALDFRALQVNTFPGPREAHAVWGGTRIEDGVEISAPAYDRLAQDGADICGLTQLAGTAVGAPFVGAVAGTLMLAQILRLLAGDRPDAVISLDLTAPRARRAVPNQVVVQFNPGYQAVY